MGGVGKTQLVRRFIELNQSNYKNIICINSQRHDLMVDEFNMLAMNLNIEKVKEKDFSVVIEEVFNKLSVSSTVILLDNVDEVRNAKSLKILLALRTSGTMPHIIMTSRIREWPVSIHLLELDVFNLKDALQYVSKKLTYKETPLEHKIELVKQLQYFPLALRQATSDIYHRRDVGYRVIDYIREFRSHKDQMLNSDCFQKHDLDLYEETTLTTWKVSIAAINEHGETGSLAIRILRIIAYFDASHIHRDTFFHLQFSTTKQVTNIKTEVESAVRLLVNHSMIDGDDLEGVLSIHKLVRDVIKIEMKHNLHLIKAILRDGLHILSEMEDFRDSHEHGISVFLAALEFKDLVEEFSLFPVMIIKSLLNYGQWSRALNFGSEILQAFSIIFEKGMQYNSRLCKCKHHSNLQMHQQIFETGTTFLLVKDSDLPSKDINWEYKETFGQSVKSFKTVQRLCEMREVNLFETKDVPLTLSSKFELEYVKNENNLHTITLFQKVFEERQTNIENDRDSDIMTINLDSILEAKYEKKVDSEVITLDGWVHQNQQCRRVYRNNCFHLSSVFSILFIEEGDFSWRINQRLQYFGQVGNKSGDDGYDNPHKQVFNKKTNNFIEHPHVLNKKFDIARLYNCVGRHSDALQMHHDVFKKRKQVLGAKHRDTLNSLLNIADTYAALGNHSKALQMHQEVFETRRKMLGDFHLDTIKSKTYVADSYHALGEYSEALKINEEILESRKYVLGENHRKTLHSMSIVAKLHSKLGKHSDALQLYRDIFGKHMHYLTQSYLDALPLTSMEDLFVNQEKSLRNVHLYAPNIMSIIASLYTNLVERSNVLQIWNEHWEITGKDYLSAFNCMLNIAASYKCLGNHHEALQIYQEVFENQNKVLGDQHPDTLNSMSNIVATYTHLGRHHDALRMYRDLFRKQMQVLGKNHLKTTQSKANIASVYSYFGKHYLALQLHPEFFLKLSSILASDHSKNVTES